MSEKKKEKRIYSKLNKKRILMLNYEFPPLGGGASPVSYEIAKGYVKNGHKVSVVTMGFHGLKSFEEKDGIKIYRVKCRRGKKEICHPHEQLIYLYSAKKFLSKHLKKNKYNIVHCHFIIPTGVLALWVKKKFGIEYVLTAHGSDVLGYNKRFSKLYPFLVKPWKKIIKEAKIVTTPSIFLLQEITKMTMEGNFLVIPNGIDSKKFKSMKKENKILIVARLFENKGVQDILDALKDIDLKDWNVDVVGEGPYRKVLEEKVRENGLVKKIKFHGWVENDSHKMKELYGKAKIFISASWFENMSIVLLEAVASECQVIASNVGGNPEVIGKEGLFEVRDINGLRKLIEKKMGEKVKVVKLDEMFSWSNVVESYEGVIQ